MSSLRTALKEYLALHRSLGFKYDRTAWELERFADFVERKGVSYITTELALEWATLPASAHPSNWAKRLAFVRRFARHLSASDPRVTVPPRHLLPYPYCRRSPYLYRDQDIKRILEAARQLHSTRGLRPLTFSTLYALYAATGLRTGEALKLDRQDVDLDRGVLTIRDSKFGRTRYVPLHLSAQRALERYAQERDRLCPKPATPAFFLSDAGTRISVQTAHKTFRKLTRHIGLRSRSKRARGPRITDLRHRLAIRTLLNWHARGVSVERRLPHLATYLGHVEIIDTYWYLTATPQLLRYALRRVERSKRRATR